MPSTAMNHRRWPRHLLGTGLLVAVFLGCAPPPDEAVPDTTPALQVQNVRGNLMPNMAAVYLDIVNSGKEADRLIKVETHEARRAETHETVDENGVARMRAHPNGFEIPAGGTLELRPGGKHIMLLKPQVSDPSLETGGGKRLRLTLHFQRAEAVEVEAPLREMGEMGDP